MASRFNKEQRQQIVRDFAIRHNGQFNPKLFLEEIQHTGPGHPAYEWFEWDGDKAAYEHRLWQAREFARDLRVTFEVEEVGRKKKVKVKQQQVPLVISPVESRKDGGGYLLFDQDDPAHMAEHCRQAAQALTTWMQRYASAVSHAGGSVSTFETQLKLLQDASTLSLEAAE